MKKVLTFLFTLTLPVILLSQAVIVFETKKHDFGKIKEEDGRASFEYVFTNRGNAPLVISKVQASCGCTTPAWTKSPVEPGQKGTITVTYNPAGRPGKFSKNINVQSNATVEREELVIKGDVIPRSKDDSKSAAKETLPIVMGNVRLESRSVEFNNIEKGIIKEHKLKIRNTSNEEVKVSFANLPSYISASLVTLTPNTEGELVFVFDSKKCSEWGQLSDEAYVVLNGKKELTDTYKITLTSNIVEDFSKMAIEQKRNAPILEIINRTVNPGVLSTSAKVEGSFLIKNIGEKTLEIRSVANNNKELSFKHKQLNIRGGKTAELKFTLSPEQKPGKYKRAITLQTNDPENVYVVLSIEWEVK